MPVNYPRINKDDPRVLISVSSAPAVLNTDSRGLDGRWVIEMLLILASEVDTFSTDFPHQRRAFVIGIGTVGHGMHRLTCVAEDVGAQIGQPV
jgi:hypothetical protein